jgi:hypothetical protein
VPVVATPATGGIAVAGPPTGAQPYAPVPSPPTYDPAAVAPPFSAQPYSVQPYSVQPYSVAPSSGAYGYGAPVGSVMPVPPRRGRTGTVVVAILATFFLLATGVMTTLFILKTQEANKLNAQVDRLSVEATDQQEELDTLQTDLDNARRDLTESRAETREVIEQKAVVSACVTAFYDLLGALARAQGADTRDVQNKERAFETACDEADKYLE